MAGTGGYAFHMVRKEKISVTELHLPAGPSVKLAIGSRISLWYQVRHTLQVWRCMIVYDRVRASASSSPSTSSSTCLFGRVGLPGLSDFAIECVKHSHSVSPREVRKCN